MLVAVVAYSVEAAYCQKERLTSHSTADATDTFPLIAEGYFFAME